MVKDDVVAAVVDARTVLANEGLLIPVEVVKRTPKPRVPGSPLDYNETSISMKMAITAFEDTELQNKMITSTHGARIQGSDMQGLLFPMDGFVSINDLVIGAGVTYRVEDSKPIYVGDTVLVTTLVLRPT